MIDTVTKIDSTADYRNGNRVSLGYGGIIPYVADVATGPLTAIKTEFDISEDGILVDTGD